MRETRADTRRAVAGALALHVLLFALMFAGLRWTRTANPVAAAGPVIEADLIDPDALDAPLREALDAPAEPPAAEPPPESRPAPPRPEPAPPEPQEAPPPPEARPQPQEFIPEPETREQARVEREAEAARQAAREQEERRRQEQVELERKRQEEAERQKRLAAERAREAKKQEIAEALAKIRAEREKAEREARLARQKLQQIEDAQARNAAEAAARADAAASPPPGNQGADPDLLAAYQAALQAAILRNWTRPESVPLGQACRIVIHQIPGGEVIDAQVDPSCPYDDLGRRSVEAAVLKAQPLPYAGFESVFNRTLELNFVAEDR